MEPVADLPIAALLPEVLDALRQHTRLIVEAAPGAGKTTQVPPALLGAEWLGRQRVIMLEPRRLAARSAATFMSEQRGEAVGATVGYRIRFENRVSAATRIEVVTEGIFTRMLQDDPGLEGVGAVIFDEFHERHLATDLGMALALDVQAGLRPELRLLLMSATLDGERIAAWLRAPRLTSEGRSFPVRIEYPPARNRETPLAHLVRVLPLALAEQPGDVLVFLPGQREISQAMRMLGTALDDPDIVLLPLHGGLSLADQRAALNPAAGGTRHVVLATNVAESSVTLPGIRNVIDLGLAREPRFDPRAGLTHLETVAISQASADQRAGRAGRVAAGTTWRLWPQSKRLEVDRRAEIQHSELSTLALELAAWGSDDLDWLEQPPQGALDQGRDLLLRLGALDAELRITRQGRQMLATGAPPRLAAAILRTAPTEQALMTDLLALIETRSPLRGDRSHDDDVRNRLAALHAWRDGGASAARLHQADSGALAAIEQIARGWRKRLDVHARASGTHDALNVGNLLLHAYPDRVARSDAQNPLRYQLANGRGARLDEASSLRGERWLVAVDLRLESRDSLILGAAPFDPALLERDYAENFNQRRVQSWNTQRQAPEAFIEKRFDALVLERQPTRLTEEDVQAALLDALRKSGLDALSWNEHSRTLRARMACLRVHCPELDLADTGDEALLARIDEWLAPFLAGVSRLDTLPATRLVDALNAMLDRSQQQALQRLVPLKLTVPSGREVAVDYRDPQAPVLAVKLQELFGLSETPTIAQGRLPLTLHLLSPAGRPIQITRDLANFWRNTYADVKKDLKGRYPRHPWPDDPMTAQATRHTTRRAQR